MVSRSRSIALPMSPHPPETLVIGLWIIMIAVGDMITSVPAMATTEAAEMAAPSILMVTLPMRRYSMSMV